MGPTGQHTTDLNNLLEEVVRIATPQLRTRATVVRKFGEIPLVECSGQEIRQVFLDLILGAARSLEGRGTIRIETSAADDQVTIVVEDNGCGYTPAEIEEVFEPVSCRTETEGARDHCVAYQIVRQHKGSIRMKSELGEGAKVSVILPINQTTPVDLKMEKANGGSMDFDSVNDV
jgi:signal transduction histidine kinase